MQQIVKVAAAIMSSNGRVLNAQRKAGHHLVGKWEFPAGNRSIFDFTRSRSIPFAFMGPGKKSFHLLLDLWSVYCVTSTHTYLDMRG